MQIVFDIDEKELKNQIARGLDREVIIQTIVNQCRWDIDSKILSSIKNSSEYKNSWGSNDLEKIKQTIDQWVRQSIENLVKKEVEIQLKKTKIPNITKTMINEILREYVDQQLVKTVQKTYAIDVAVKVNKECNM